ncbi:predicted protein [Histoplasma capsulatum var. duboisii H88]|uniref:Predicted protein n=2 Tax=Ajellomyces capsulatus TaxID=5037 RepID=F0UVN4_AJEC8|nr:predicted protein [Histoplasma capsulatum H143]EGC49961.1 predicted protein [Histoplasma capsulatum var. duboisii H88]
MAKKSDYLHGFPVYDAKKFSEAGGIDIYMISKWISLCQRWPVLEAVSDKHHKLLRLSWHFLIFDASCSTDGVCSKHLDPLKIEPNTPPSEMTALVVYKTASSELE